MRLTLPDIQRILLSAFAALLLQPATAGAELLDENGTFAFLNETLPVGSTNTEYVARLVTINADGPVTFSSDPLPPGLVIDSVTGLLTGRPTETANVDIEFTADDGFQIAATTINIKINSSGGGGNGGSEVDAVDLPAGRIGEPYSETVTLEGGVGPFVFAAAKLPSGLGIDGLTGEISGTPIAAGTFYSEISISDAGENNRVVTVRRIQIMPAASEFQFTTVMLNNGEVGTPFCDTWTTENGIGTVTFSASGLPPGLTVDSTTGLVTGTPTEAGTFEVVLNATDDEGTISMNRPMIVVNGGGSMYWVFSAIPNALINEAYDRQPPILVPAANFETIAYSATGLPAGMAYNPLTGEVSGTPLQVGEYPIVFTATDTTTNETIHLAVGLLVLPPNGGDANSLAANVWISKHRLKTTSETRDSWMKPEGKLVSAIYNDDRRKGARFNPKKQGASISIGSTSIDVEPGEFSGNWKQASYQSPDGETPVEEMKLNGLKQQIKWILRKASIADSVPGVLQMSITLGDRGFQIDGFLDEDGYFVPTLDYRRAAFVVKTGQLRVRGGGRDKAIFSMRFGDPAFRYESGVTVLRFRLLNEAEVLIDKEFTTLVGGVEAVDARTGSPIYTLESTDDPANSDKLRRFKFTSSNGKMLLELTKLDMPLLAPGDHHLTAELTIGQDVYYTSITFFEPESGEYMTNRR